MLRLFDEAFFASGGAGIVFGGSPRASAAVTDVSVGRGVGVGSACLGGGGFFADGATEGFGLFLSPSFLGFFADGDDTDRFCSSACLSRS